MDIKKGFIDLTEALEKARADYNQSAECIVEALTGFHNRLERVEKWMSQSVELEKIKS